jgi:hypothetical protein
MPANAPEPAAGGVLASTTAGYGLARSLAGLLIAVALHQADESDRTRDPAVQAAWKYLEKHASVRSGEPALHFRFWMAEETYQTVSSVQSLIFLAVVKYYLTTPRLAFTFFPCASPDFWAPMLGYASLVRLPEADFSVKHRLACMGMTGAQMPARWLSSLRIRWDPVRTSRPRAR